jgi:hypothetical protein
MLVPSGGPFDIGQTERRREARIHQRLPQARIDDVVPGRPLSTRIVSVKFFASQWRTVSINSNSAWLNLISVPPGCARRLCSCLVALEPRGSEA